MTPNQLDRRIIRSRQALAEWARKKSDINQSLIDTEIGVLKSLAATAPEAKRAKIEALIARFYPAD